MSTNNRNHWWNADKGRAFGALSSVVQRLSAFYLSRRSLISEGRWLYGEKNSPFASHVTATSAAPVNVNPVMGRKGALQYNLIRVAVDSLGARISQAKPKATFTTTGGTWSQQRRAKRLDDFVYGVFHDAGIYAIGQDVFRDGCLGDLGALKGYTSGGKIHLERVLPEDIRVDPVDAMHGKPRSLIHTSFMARDKAHTLADAWHQRMSKSDREEMHRKIDAAATVSMGNAVIVQASLGDVVEVHEAWRLPSGPGAKDGRHVLCLSNVDLLDEDWTSQRFPFAFFRYTRPMLGFYGGGTVDILRGQQRAINGLLHTITESLRLMSVPRYFLPANAQFNIDQLRNVVGEVWRGTAKPEVLTGNVVPGELLRAYRDAIQDGLEQVGVSRTWATGQKEAGLNSAVALREQMDIQSDRFALVAQEYERFYMQAARLVLDLAAKSEEDGEPLTAITPKRGSFISMKWGDVRMDEGAFVLQMDTSSSLPLSPAARRQQVQEWLELGAIDTTDYRRLMDVPDLKSSNSLVSSARDYVDSLCERFLDGDTGDFDFAEVFRPPEPFDDLAYGIRRMSAEYSRARLAGAPPERLELFQTWMEQARALAQPPAPPPGAEPQTAPTDAPAAPEMAA